MRFRRDLTLRQRTSSSPRRRPIPAGACASVRDSWGPRARGGRAEAGCSGIYVLLGRRNEILRPRFLTDDRARCQTAMPRRKRDDWFRLGKLPITTWRELWRKLARLITFFDCVR